MADKTNLGNLFSTSSDKKQSNAQTYMEAYSKNANTFAPLSQSSDSYIAGVSNKMNLANSFYDAGMSDQDVAKYMYIHDQAQQGKGYDEIEGVLSNPDKSQSIVDDYTDMKSGYDTYLKDQNLFNEMGAEAISKYNIEAHYKDFMSGGDSGVRDLASKLAGMNSILRSGTKMGISDIIDNNQHDLKGTMFDISKQSGATQNDHGASFQNKLDVETLKAKGLTDNDIKKMQGDEEYFYNFLDSMKKGHEENKVKSGWDKAFDWLKAVGTSVLHGAWDIVSSPFQIVNAVQAAFTGNRWDDGGVSSEMESWVTKALKGHSGAEKKALGIIDGIAEFVPAIALEIGSMGTDTPGFITTSASILSRAGMIIPSVSSVQASSLALNRANGKTGIADNLGAFGKAAASGILFAAAGKLTGAGFGAMPGVKNLMGQEAGNLFATRTLAKLGASSLENTATMYGLGRMNDFLTNVGNENVGSSFLRMITPVQNGKADMSQLASELINSGVSGTIFGAASLFRGTRNANKLVKTTYKDMVKYSPSVESIKQSFVENGMSDINAQDAALKYLSDSGVDVSPYIQNNSARIYGEKVSQNIENSITTSTNMLDGYLKHIYESTGDERFNPKNSKLDASDAMSHALKYGFPTEDPELLKQKGFITNEDFKNLLEINDMDPSAIKIEEIKNKKGTKVLRKRPLLQKSTSHNKYDKLSEAGKRALDGLTGEAKIKKLDFMSESKENESIATDISGDKPTTQMLKDNKTSFADVEKMFGESNPWTTEQQVSARKEHETYVVELKEEIGKAISTGDMTKLNELVAKTSMEDIHSLYEGKKITSKEYSKLLDIKEIYDSASEMYKGSKDTIKSIQDVSINPVKDIVKFENIIDNENIDDKFVKDNLNGEQKALFDSVGNKVDLFDRIQKMHDRNKIEKQFKKDIKKMGYEKAVEKMNADIKAKEQAPAVFEPAKGDEERFAKEREAQDAENSRLTKEQVDRVIKNRDPKLIEKAFVESESKGNGQEFMNYVEEFLATPGYEDFENGKAMNDWYQKNKDREIQSKEDWEASKNAPATIDNKPNPKEESFNKKITKEALKNAKQKELIKLYDRAVEDGKGEEFVKYVDDYLKANKNKTPSYEGFLNYQAISKWFKKHQILKELEANKDITVFDEQEVKLSNSKAAVAARAKTKADAVTNAKADSLVIKGNIPAEKLNNAKTKEILNTELKKSKRIKTQAELDAIKLLEKITKSENEKSNLKDNDLFDFEYKDYFEESHSGQKFITKDINKAMWITTDGKMINGGWGENGGRLEDHSIVLNEDIGINDVLHAGGIRVMHELKSIQTWDGKNTFLSKKTKTIFNKYIKDGYEPVGRNKFERDDAFDNSIEHNPFKPEVTKKAEEVKDVVQQQVEEVKKTIPENAPISDIKTIEKDIAKFDKKIVSDKRLSNARFRYENASPKNKPKMKKAYNKLRNEHELNLKNKKEYINKLTSEQIAEIADWSWGKINHNLESFVSTGKTDSFINFKDNKEFYTDFTVKHGTKISTLIQAKQQYIKYLDANRAITADRFPDDLPELKIMLEAATVRDKSRKGKSQAEIETNLINKLVISRKIKDIENPERAARQEKSRETLKQKFVKRAKEMKEKQLKEQKQKVVKLKTSILDGINEEHNTMSKFHNEASSKKVDIDSSITKGKIIESVMSSGNHKVNFAIKEIEGDYIVATYDDGGEMPNQNNWTKLDDGKKLYKDLQNKNISLESKQQILNHIEDKLYNLEDNKKAVEGISVQDIIDSKPIPKNLKDQYFSKFENWEDALNEINKVADEEVKNSGDLEFERKVCK